MVFRSQDIVMAYVVMAVGVYAWQDIVMAYIVMAVGVFAWQDIVMAYIVMAGWEYRPGRISHSVTAPGTGTHRCAWEKC